MRHVQATRSFGTGQANQNSAQTSGRSGPQRHNPRESMQRFPARIQWILTEMTGKASPGERPPWKWTPLRRLALTILVLIMGLTLSWASVAFGRWFWALLPFGWLLTVAAMRTFQTSFVHHAAHGALLKNDKYGRWLAELLSTLVVIQPESEYRSGHRLHHGKTATTDDPDLQLLVEFGFRPGRTIPQYWWQFVNLMLSPKFHTKYALIRLRSNFLAASAIRRLMSLAWATILFLFAATTGSIWQLTFVWLIPAWPLFQMTGLMQLLTEHNWVRIGERSESPKVILGRLTHDRYFGEEFPANAGVAGTVFWIARMLLIHFPMKLMVAQADLANHSWHHRVPQGDWANAAYHRRDAVLVQVSAGSANGWPEYTECWGFIEAANATFRLLSSLPPNAVLGQPLTYGEISEGILGM